jgi:hypothetical protein
MNSGLSALGLRAALSRSLCACPAFTRGHLMSSQWSQRTIALRHRDPAEADRRWRGRGAWSRSASALR